MSPGPAGPLHAGHTHLYPGAMLRGPADALQVGQRLWIAFADLGCAAAEVLAIDDGQPLLAVDAHVTARGTPVIARCWRLQRQPGNTGDSTTACWKLRRA